MFCEHCGAKLEARMTYCEKCGAKRPSAEAAAAPPAPQPGAAPATAPPAPTDAGEGAKAGGIAANRRLLRPALFGLALVCFVLPFVSVSCNDEKLGTFSGTELVFGTTVKLPVFFTAEREEHVNGEPLGIAAFVLVLGALGMCFWRHGAAWIGQMGASAVSLICLFQLKSRLQSEVAGQMGGVLNVHYEIGFWITVLLIIAGAATALADAKQAGPGAAAAAPGAAPPT